MLPLLNLSRKTQIFHIQDLHIETAKVDEFIEVLKPGLKTFMQLNGAKVTKIHQVTGIVELSKKHLQALSNACKFFNF